MNPVEVLEKHDFYDLVKLTLGDMKQTDIVCFEEVQRTSEFVIAKFQHGDSVLIGGQIMCTWDLEEHCFVVKC